VKGARAAGAAVLTLLISSRPIAAQAPPSLDSLLRDQAGALVERFGDTFYALGWIVTVDGQSEPTTANQWPPLDAPPDDWEDSLVATLRGERARLRAAAYLVDRYRLLDSTRVDSTYAIFHFEAAGGRCVEQRRHYTITDAGRVRWDDAVALPCRVRVWVP
jgi:hypothetical protein